MSNITATPHKPHNVDVNKITFSGVKSLPSGAKIIYLNYEGNSLFVQSPETTVPYDVEHSMLTMILQVSILSRYRWMVSMKMVK